MAGRALRLETKTSRKSAAPVAQVDDKVAIRAYEIWMERGCPENTELEDWYKAEAEIKAGSGG
jgi:hypothetical protein